MFLNQHSDFQNLKDLNENISLDDIPVLCSRIESLIIRNKHKITMAIDFVQIWTSLEMVHGMEYHFNNLQNHLKRLSNMDCLGDDTMLDHETVAYLHRLRQFYYFIKSRDLFKVSPKINELYLFGRKLICHRSIDDPWEEDEEADQIWQAQCFHNRSFSGNVKPDFDPKKGILKDLNPLSPKRYQSDKMFVSYQILSNGKHATFTPQQDHPIVVKEIESAFIRLFANEELPPRKVARQRAPAKK